MTLPRAFAIVPAAGRSERMGRPKLLLPWRGMTVIEHVLAAWRASAVTATVVVVRHDDNALGFVCQRCGVDVVLANPPPRDMKASVAVGADYIAAHYSPADDDLWLVAPADLPQLSPSLIAAVLEHAQTTKASIIVPMHADRRGHPCAFRWRLSCELPTLATDEGLNELFSRHSVATVDVSDQSALADLDTPEDYRRLILRD